MRAHDGAAEPIARIEAHGKAAGRAIGGDPAVVGDELPGRVFRRDAALQRHAAGLDLVLRGDVDWRLVQRMPSGDEELALHQVDAGDHLGHGVFDLDARVDLDEVERARVDIHEEFDSARAAVADGRAELDGGRADARAQVLRQADGRRHFHDFLVTALDGAVALPQVHQVAVRVAEDLHLDVLGVGDVPFEEHLVASEGHERLALCLLQLVGELALAGYDPHAATAAAEARFNHQREANGACRRNDRVRVAQRRGGAGHRGDADLSGKLPCGRLVAEEVQMLRRRSHERDAPRLAGLGKGRALGQEAVAGMNRVHPVLLGHRHQLVDVEIGADRLSAFRRSNQERLVGLEPVKRKTVFVAEDRHRPQAQLGGGAEAADGDF